MQLRVGLPGSRALQEAEKAAEEAREAAEHALQEKMEQVQAIAEERDEARSEAQRLREEGGREDLMEKQEGSLGSQGRRRASGRNRATLGSKWGGMHAFEGLLAPRNGPGGWCSRRKRSRRSSGARCRAGRIS